MNTLCLRTSLSLTSTSLLSLSSPYVLSPFLSFLRPQSSTFIHSLNRIKSNNINKSLLSSSPSTHLRKNINNNYYNKNNNIFSRINGSSATHIFKKGNIYNKIEKRTFHTTRPLQAGATSAFRLASFVAPIIMRQVRSWIGTPSTNSYFLRRLFTVLALLVGIPGFYIYTHLEATPYTDRVRFVALTSDDEAELGEMAFMQLVEEHESDFIPGHHHFVSKVTKVAERIIEACERPDIKWEVCVVDSPIYNAFAIPGGKIFVFSGILDVTENDDGLAFILGHEVAHVLARHSAEQMTLGRVMLGFSVFLSAIFGDNIGSFGLSKAISLLTELKYSRNMEREADYIGLLLMQKAKYNIDEAPRVWARMMQKTGDGSDQIPFLSTHPSNTDRIHDISQWVDELKAEKKRDFPIEKLNLIL